MSTVSFKVTLESNGKVRQFKPSAKVIALSDGADSKVWYVSLSRARAAMHVYTRNKTALHQSVMQPGERKSVWELLQAVARSKVQSRNRMMPDLWAARQAQTVRATEMEH